MYSKIMIKSVLEGHFLISSNNLYGTLELLQECDIRVLEIAHIRDSVLDHDKTIESEPEGESGVFIGIYPSFTKDIRVHETGPHEFDPSGFFTDLATFT